MVFYAAFNSISVISRRQLTLFMLSWVSPLASIEAGHTGVGNELVSICDELKRQGVLNLKSYKNLITNIKSKD